MIDCLKHTLTLSIVLSLKQKEFFTRQGDDTNRLTVVFIFLNS